MSKPLVNNALILHGTGSTPADFWFPYLVNKLNAQDWKAQCLALPYTETPDLVKQLPFVKNNWDFNSETCLIAHSAGCPLALAILETLPGPIKKTILVAGYLDLGNSDDKIIKKNYNWNKIRANAGEVYIINSDNDPWGCDHQQGQLIFQNLGGNLIIRHGEGHMGSLTYNQPYREFPLLMKLII
jgi:uncharacterized protein